MIFSVSARIGANEGFYALYEIDNKLEEMILKEEL